MNRRDFLQNVSGAAALGLLEPPIATALLPGHTDRLSWRANRTAGAEGAWRLEQIEGEIPAQLFGTLYRTAPGQSEVHGVKLRHFFDGDAYVSGFSFREGRVDLRGRFIDTPERRRELDEGEMVFSEYGTYPPSGESLGWKNPPSVNIVPWGGQLLGLSEGGHPTAIDPKTLRFKRRWNFKGSLTPAASFTAHPRFHAGVGYAYGLLRGPTTPLLVFRLEQNGRARMLHQVPLKGYHMIHDMLLSKRHIVFGIPPVTYDPRRMIAGGSTPAEALRYFDKEPLRYVVLPRDGDDAPITIDAPPQMVYHHANAFERDGKIVVDSLLSPGNTVNELLHRWSKDELIKPEGYGGTDLIRYELDPVGREIVSRSVLARDVEFPRWDERGNGSDLGHLFAARGTSREDPFAWTEIVRVDLNGGEPVVAEAGQAQCFGEPVFVPLDDGDCVLHLGYDGARDLTFLDIRDAATLERRARVWAPTNLPLGFHGNFTADHFVEV